jgi:hypothetical protein
MRSTRHSVGVISKRSPLIDETRLHGDILTISQYDFSRENSPNRSMAVFEFQMKNLRQWPVK